MEPGETYYTIKEFAKKVGVHENTVRRAIFAKRLFALQIGSGNRCVYRIPGNELIRLGHFKTLGIQDGT